MLPRSIRWGRAADGNGWGIVNLVSMVEFLHRNHVDRSNIYGTFAVVTDWSKRKVEIWGFRFTWGVEMMPQSHAWGWHPPQTISYIHIRHIKSIFDFDMLSQGHMVSPLYRYTGQVAPRFGDSGSLEEWKRFHNVMFKADIHLRLLHTSTLDIYKVFETLVCWLKCICIAPLYHYTGQVAPRFGDSGSLEEWKWCNNLMVEAHIHLRPLHTSILDIYKVFLTFVCCLKAIWLYPYNVTLAKLHQDLGIQVHLRSGNDAIMSCLRLILTSDHFIHPH